jgi:DNA-binding response OmpR family regulator
LTRHGIKARVDEQIRVGNLVLNRLTRRVTCDANEVALTAMELKLLEHLMMRCGEIVTRSELHDKVWDMHFDPSSNVIDAHVARLRKKLRSTGADTEIETRRGVGFTLTSHPVTPHKAAS